ncbi:MAG: hypothetical protein NXI20_13355 [bacterium]|nr:hypothetical protein [bacterium]
MAVKWDTLNGEKILYVDLSNMSDTKIMVFNLDEGVRRLKEDPSPTALVLINLTNTSLGLEFMRQAKDKVKELLKAKECKTAMTGLTGLQKVIFDAYRKFTGSKAKLFQNEFECETYLAPPRPKAMA